MMGGPMSVERRAAWIAPLCALLRDAVGARAGDRPLPRRTADGEGARRAASARTRDAGDRLARRRRLRPRRARANGSAAAPRSTRSSGITTRSTLPAGATRVLTNALQSPTRPSSIDDRHIGFQCHVEMTRELVETWCSSGARRAAGAVERAACRAPPTSCARSRRAHRGADAASPTASTRAGRRLRSQAA